MGQGYLFFPLLFKTRLEILAKGVKLEKNKIHTKKKEQS